ncbi:MAG: nitroreductase family protein [Hahellaceae bacterium]|nr:nitroreductase family protein [Hahellaceae bacterium]
MQFSEVLRDRHSVRDFSAQAVSDEQIESLLSQALRSPSWSNTQPYRIAVARGAVRDRLALAYSQKFERATRLQGRPRWQQLLMGAALGCLPDGDFKPVLNYPPELHERRVATGHGLYRLLGIERRDMAARNQQMARNYAFFGAPVVMFVCVHEGLGAYSVLDAGILLQSLMLAAKDQGLDSCAQGALAMWRSPLDKEFEIPSAYKLICGLSLGYASDAVINQFDPGRRPLQEFLIPAKS